MLLQMGGSASPKQSFAEPHVLDARGAPPLAPFRRRIAAQDFEGFGGENVPQTFPTKV